MNKNKVLEIVCNSVWQIESTILMIYFFKQMNKNYLTRCFNNSDIIILIAVTLLCFIKTSEVFLLVYHTKNTSNSIIKSYKELSLELNETVDRI